MTGGGATVSEEMVMGRVGRAEDSPSSKGWLGRVVERQTVVWM